MKKQNMNVSYSGSYIGSHKTNDGQDIVYSYPPDFVMTFPKYRRQSSWERDAILDKALMEYVNREVHAPAVVRYPTGDERGSKTELLYIDKRDIPTGITGGKLTEEAEKAVDDILNCQSSVPVTSLPDRDKAAGLNTAKIQTIAKAPLILVAIAIGVLIYLLGRK